jgi:3-methyl-2-oxobutanoate hydroxymethyltransferase
MKIRGEPIAMLTAYDYTFARLLEEAGIDVILVGDSASNVIAGHETTLPITLDQMIYHASAVVRAVERAMVVVDMPFGSYQGDSRAALKAAIRIMKESGAHAVKLEGGRPILSTVRRLVEAGIPVMGHLGLTPQAIYQFGSYRVRAQDEAEAQRLYEDALALAEAGIFALVLTYPSQPSGSELDPIVMDKCWYYTTCWDSTKPLVRDSYGDMPIYIAS